MMDSARQGKAGVAVWSALAHVAQGCAGSLGIGDDLDFKWNGKMAEKIQKHVSMGKKFSRLTRF
jgi:hypothetical protein